MKQQQHIKGGKSTEKGGINEDTLKQVDSRIRCISVEGGRGEDGCVSTETHRYHGFSFVWFLSYGNQDE
jgi:hypothetical protein